MTPAVLHILLSLAAEDRHGLGIAADVKAFTQGRLTLGPGTLYGTIKRLLDAGAGRGPRVAVRRTLSDPRRRYYRITAKGRRALELETEGLTSVLGVASEDSRRHEPRTRDRRRITRIHGDLGFYSACSISIRARSASGSSRRCWRSSPNARRPRIAPSRAALLFWRAILGDLLRSALRERFPVWSWRTPMGELGYDIRQAWRTVTRAPLLTAFVVLLMTLSIGSTTAVFSIVNAVLLRPFPVCQPRSAGDGVGAPQRGEPAQHRRRPRIPGVEGAQPVVRAHGRDRVRSRVQPDRRGRADEARRRARDVRLLSGDGGRAGSRAAVHRG